MLLGLAAAAVELFLVLTRLVLAAVAEAALGGAVITTTVPLFLAVQGPQTLVAAAVVAASTLAIQEVTEETAVLV
jgi:hypothetical protein